MPRVVPSQVVTFIDTLWPTTDQQKNINALQAGRLSGLVELTDEVPGKGSGSRGCSRREQNLWKTTTIRPRGMGLASLRRGGHPSRNHQTGHRDRSQARQRLS